MHGALFATKTYDIHLLPTEDQWCFSVHICSISETLCCNKAN